MLSTAKKKINNIRKTKDNGTRQTHAMLRNEKRTHLRRFQEEESRTLESGRARIKTGVEVTQETKMRQSESNHG